MRHKRIREGLLNCLTIQEIASQLKVNPLTINRDLHDMAADLNIEKEELELASRSDEAYTTTKKNLALAKSDNSKRAWLSLLLNTISLKTKLYECKTKQTNIAINTQYNQQNITVTATELMKRAEEIVQKKRNEVIEGKCEPGTGKDTEKKKEGV